MSDIKLAQTLSKHTLACEVGGGAKRIADLILKLLMKKCYIKDVSSRLIIRE